MFTARRNCNWSRFGVVTRKTWFRSSPSEYWMVQLSNWHTVCNRGSPPFTRTISLVSALAGAAIAISSRQTTSHLLRHPDVQPDLHALADFISRSLLIHATRRRRLRRSLRERRH